MWRMGFDSPENFDDDQTYCGSVEQETFYTHSCLILTAGVGAFNGMKIVDVVESVEILGMTFPENTRHPWVKHSPWSPCRNHFYQGNLPREQSSGSMSPGPGSLSLLISPQTMVATSYSSFVRTMTLHKTPVNPALISMF